MAGSDLARKLRAMVGMSSSVEDGSQENVRLREKYTNRKLCEAGQEEYCPPKNIPTPTPGNGERPQKEMMMGTENYNRKRK